MHGGVFLPYAGRACVEAVLEMSAQEVAGSKSPGHRPDNSRLTILTL
jgi:hypothetical protein